jgi:hypothetical protein
MVSNYPHPITSSEGMTSAAEHVHPSEERFSGRILDRVRQIFCGLHGHDVYLQFEADRMFLRCVSCGHESPGWELNEAPPLPIDARNEQGKEGVGDDLIGERRIA